MKINNITLSIVAALAAACGNVPMAAAADADPEEDAAFNYTPNIHGVIRSRWEEDLDAGLSRFQLRNARVMLDGRIAPTIDYYLQVDLCDQGTLKFLDGWARMQVARGLRVQAGQFRVPFGVDPFRSPVTYIFSNRSFIGKQVCNVRGVGMKVMYELPRVPLTLEGGVFNPSSISDHTGWHSSYAWAGRAIYRPGAVRLDAGFKSIRPDGVRMNLIDGAIGWTGGRWMLEGEYMYKHYTHRAHRASHAYNVWADYRMPVKAGVFNRLSFQGRLDGMTAHSGGKRNADGRLTTDDPARNRITLGSTISCVRRNVWLDLRLNYEKYLYRHGVTPATGQGDRLGIELSLRF